MTCSPWLDSFTKHTLGFATRSGPTPKAYLARMRNAGCRRKSEMTTQELERPGNGLASGLLQKEIDDPASSHVRYKTAAEVEGVVTPGLLKGIGKDRHRRGVAAIVHLPRRWGGSGNAGGGGPTTAFAGVGEPE